MVTSVSLPTIDPNLHRRDVHIGERTNRSFYSLRNQFTSKNLSRRTKLELYSTYIVPVLTYAFETWTLFKSDETFLDAFERKMLRRILDSVCVEGQWRSRYNDELYDMYGDLTVVQRFKLASS